MLVKNIKVYKSADAILAEVTIDGISYRVLLDDFCGKIVGSFQTREGGILEPETIRRIQKTIDRMREEAEEGCPVCGSQDIYPTHASVNLTDDVPVWICDKCPNVLIPK